MTGSRAAARALLAARSVSMSKTGAGIPASPSMTISPGGGAAAISASRSPARAAGRLFQPSIAAIVCTIRCAGGLSAQYAKISSASAKVIASITRKG